MAALTLEGKTPQEIAEMVELAQAANDLFSNPATRERALQLRKEVRPELRIPEIDVPHQFNAALAEERRKREALENRLLEDEVRRGIEAKRNEMVKMGVPADKVGDVERMMVERSIGDHSTAAEFYLAQQKLATPTSPNIGQRFHSQALPNMSDAKKDFGGNVWNWAKAQAMNVLQARPLGG